MYDYSERIERFAIRGFASAPSSAKNYWVIEKPIVIG